MRILMRQKVAAASLVLGSVLLALLALAAWIVK
jgi:hypothetical protein